MDTEEPGYGAPATNSPLVATPAEEAELREQRTTEGNILPNNALLQNGMAKQNKKAKIPGNRFASGQQDLQLSWC